MKTLVLSFLMITIIIAYFTIEGEAFPKDGLVLHLSFDKSVIKDNKVEDLSDKGNDGIINGGAKTVAGKFGEALEFDGTDDFVEIPLTDSITFTKDSSFTAQVWIKTEDEPPQNDGLVGNYRPSTDALWMLSVRGDDPALRGKMGFSVRDKGRAHSAGITSPDFLNDNNWHHLAGVRDQKAKQIRFYVDGKLIEEKDDPTEDINSGQSVWIGEHLNRFYKGLIDDVKLWDRALSADELDKSMSGITSVATAAKIATLWGLVKKQR